LRSTPTYPIAIGSLFAIGAGFAALQVAINPLLRVAGGEEHFAYYSAFAQLVFGAASFVSPLVFAYLLGQLKPGVRTARLWAAGAADAAGAAVGVDVLAVRAGDGGDGRGGRRGAIAKGRAQRGRVGRARSACTAICCATASSCCIS
jgi:hypothetical protein